MVTNLRDAKASLSQLVQAAAEGEEILITVRGKPRARLVGIDAAGSSGGDRRAWVEELVREAQESACGDPVSTSQEYWDEVRSDRS